MTESSPLAHASGVAHASGDVESSGVTIGATIGDTGEFALIGRITAELPESDAVLVGPGDDTALIAAASGSVLATIDVLVEGTHFRRDWSSAADIGHKAAAASLADIAAMGGVATALLVGFAASADLPLDWALECAAGIAAEAAVVGACVVGGDVVASPIVTVSVTVLGDMRGRTPVLRSGARPGDVVALAGRLGWSAAGLAMLSSGLSAPSTTSVSSGVKFPPKIYIPKRMNMIINTAANKKLAISSLNVDFKTLIITIINLKFLITLVNLNILNILVNLRILNALTFKREA